VRWALGSQPTPCSGAWILFSAPEDPCWCQAAGSVRRWPPFYEYSREGALGDSDQLFTTLNEPCGKSWRGSCEVVSTPPLRFRWTMPEIFLHRTGVRMGSTIGVAFQRDGRHGDTGAPASALSDRPYSGSLPGESEPASRYFWITIANMIGIFERGCAVYERGVIETPFRRCSCQISFAKSCRFMS